MENILEKLNIILEDYNKAEKSFDLAKKFEKNKKKQSHVKDEDQKTNKLKEKLEQIKNGTASLEDLEELISNEKKY